MKKALFPRFSSFLGTWFKHTHRSLTQSAGAHVKAQEKHRVQRIPVAAQTKTFPGNSKQSMEKYNKIIRKSLFAQGSALQTKLDYTKSTFHFALGL